MHKRFIDGKYVYHPLVHAGIIYVGCPREAMILLDELDYSEISNDKIIEDAKSRLSDFYPDCEFDWVSVLENVEFHMAKGRHD